MTRLIVLMVDHHLTFWLEYYFCILESEYLGFFLFHILNLILYMYYSEYLEYPWSFSLCDCKLFILVYSSQNDVRYFGVS